MGIHVVPVVFYIGADTRLEAVDDLRSELHNRLPGAQLDGFFAFPNDDPCTHHLDWHDGPPCREQVGSLGSESIWVNLEQDPPSL